MKAQPTFLDWDSIREAEGFKVGDHVRSRGAAVGVIKNLILASPGRMRARVYWPTVPFTCEGVVCSSGSAQFIDLADLTTKKAMDYLRAQMQADPEYAWTWHCNIAVSAMDAGVHPSLANEAAAMFMSNLFDVDTRKNPAWESRRQTPITHADLAHSAPEK